MMQEILGFPPKNAIAKARQESRFDGLTERRNKKLGMVSETKKHPCITHIYHTNHTITPHIDLSTCDSFCLKGGPALRGRRKNRPHFDK